MMGSDHCVSVIVLTLTAFHCFTFAITPADARDDAPASLQLDSAPLDLQVSLYDGTIVVSAGMELLLLDPNLTVSSIVMVHDRIRGQRIALSHNTSNSVLVCKEEFCSHYDVDWMYDEEIYEFVSPVARGFDSVPLSIEPTGFYIATSDGQSIDIKQLDENGNSLRDYNWAFNNNQFYQRQFLEGFQYGDFVYFVARDNGTSELANKVRVIRLCHGFTMRAFSAAYEAILECGEMSASSKVEVSSSLLDEFGNPMITFAVTTDEDTNICSFSLNNINAEMDASYTRCSSNENSSLIIPLAWYNERTCGTFSNFVEDQCDFKLANEIRAIPALATFESIPGQHHLRLNESEEITAVLTVRVGSYTDLIFVAYTTSSEEYFLDKYHITGNGTLELVLREPQSKPVTFMRWNAIMEEIYIANANSVFQVPLESCSNYTTCGECTSSKDPLCGWCTLEQYCSRDIDCPRHSDKGHWVAGQEQCIMSVSLAIDSMDVDLIQNVDLTINPQEATLPSSPAGGYQCSFYHTNHENVSYAFTTPFTGGACQLQESDIDDFVGKRIDLSFALQIPNQPTELFPSTAVLALHNCSLHTECAECVGASSACGWCVHDRICTGNPSKCRHTDDWRSRADSEESSVSAICPMVLTPDHGSYTLPVAVRRELILSTLNIPPEIPGYQYGCQMKYGNGTVLPLMSEYHNHTYFRCVITENQVHMSGSVANGTEVIELELLWIRIVDNDTTTLHSVKVTLYDCTQLGTDCSSCLSANLRTGFECSWCDRLQVEDECTVLDHCIIQSTVTSRISKCPLPIIANISPRSGPTVGGTVLTVNGSNLGAVVADVIVELVNTATMERVPCIVDNTKYIPGIQVVCTTEAASEGKHWVSVGVHRGSTIAYPLMLEQAFTYAHPIVKSVTPLRGPKAGGTEVTILGSNLDIGTPEIAEVFIGETQCDIQSVLSTMIVCTSRPVTVASVQHRVRILIDNADMHSELYNYTEDPVFTKVEPQNTIPAGGVNLTFRGNYLDVVLNPKLTVVLNPKLTVGNYTLSGVCIPQSSTTLRCIAPKLPKDFTLDAFERERRSRNTDNSLNYTVKMDGADGPVSSSENLKLRVKPNPVFTMLHEEDKEYILESEHTIRILGSNIDSVLPSELAVMVDDATCTVVTDDVTATQIRCFPPNTILPGDRYVKVFVGKSGLNYSVGFLRYRKAQSGSNSNRDILIITAPVLAGVIILTLTLLSIGCCAAGGMIRRKRAYKAKRRVFNEDKNTPVLNNMYRPVGEHDYDTIPEVLEQMQIQQLQQMEMIACAAQDETLTDISAAKRNSNIYYSEDEGRGSSAGSSNLSRPNSSSTSGSRPLSSSTTGSVSNKSVKRPPLPPLPTSMSDEYVAMHSFSVAEANAIDSTQVQGSSSLPRTATATVVVNEPSTSDKEEKGADAVGYDKLAPREKSAPDTSVVSLPEQQQEESAA